MTAPHTRTAVTVRVFSQRLSATRRGARLARRLTVHQLDGWGVPYGSETSETVALIVAELAANAVLHGRLAGRDFALRLTCTPPGTVRVEVTDPRGERLPRIPPFPEPDADGGRGLLLVDSLASRWGVDTRPGPGKTVWAEVQPGFKASPPSVPSPSSGGS
ncbi:ATP-binding protein [Streptomyces anandii]|uniref:ATP-binding protein n=1 Tax=Streptomyces anandii TaxID=285454 RepID=UPI0036FB1EA2